MIDGRKEIFVICIHLLIGLLSIFSIFFFVAWFFIVIFLNIKGIIQNKARGQTILYLSWYVFGLELIARMIKSSPFIPYSIGTYYMLFVFAYGILMNTRAARFNIGSLIFFLCLPAFVMIPTENYFTYLVNSLSPILCLALGSIYFSYQRYSITEINNFIKCIIFPILIIAFYITIKSPSLDDVNFTLAANVDTTGGFGSNQISTALGVGTSLLLLVILNYTSLYQSRYLKYFSIILICYFLFRGFLTFSRGGIIGGLISVLLAYIYLSWKRGKGFGKRMVLLLFVFTAGFLIFNFTDKVTSGLLTIRYKGETPGTYEGYRQRNLGTLTSNRSELAIAEWDIFSKNPYLGVGPGGGYEAREEYIDKNIASHTEITRLLAEQGIPGLIIVFIFLLYPFIRISKSKSNQETYYLICFYSLAIITSMHSGMRTIVTPLLWSICAARIYIPNRNIIKPYVPDETSYEDSDLSFNDRLK